MAKTETRKTSGTGRKSSGKIAYEPPRLEKFEKLEKLVVSGE